MAAASVGATNSRAVQPHRNPSPEPSSQASSSSPSFSSRAAEAEAWPVSCDGGAEEDVLHLDSLWVAAAEAESRLEEAAMAAAAAGLRLCAENEAEADEIRDNLQRQDDELMALEAIYGDDLAELENKGALRYFQSYPSKEPPYFAITAKWMDGPNVCQLCEMLDTIWAELPGEEVASGKVATRGMVEMLSIKVLYSDVKSCPKCRMTISKTKGCNKVVCISCGQAFCFLCGEAAIGGYAHFRGNCGLFEEEKDTRDWQKLMEQLGRQVERQPIGSTVKCPKCRQKIYKDDDKYIFCWACQASYCTMCKKPVQFTGVQGEHWGSPECIGTKF
ncbi:hypothetical protein ACQ4PT_066921 [Festuca glaucescens]